MPFQVYGGKVRHRDHNPSSQFINAHPSQYGPRRVLGSASHYTSARAATSTRMRGKTRAARPAGNAHPGRARMCAYVRAHACARPTSLCNGLLGAAMRLACAGDANTDSPPPMGHVLATIWWPLHFGSGRTSRKQQRASGWLRPSLALTPS